MNTKVCQDCRESIDDEAKICPHCHGYQRTLDRIFTRSTTATIFQAIVWPALAIWVIIWFQFYIKEMDVIYSPHDIIAVDNIDIQFGDDKDSRIITILGKLTNSSDKGFVSTSLNIELYDASGNLIDVLNQQACNVLLPPSGSATFRVSGQPAVDEGRYSSAKVTVLRATPDG